MQYPPLYAGLCEKRGGGRSLFGSTAWKVRFAVIRRVDRALAYYDDETTYVLHPLEFKKSPLFLPAYAAHEEAGAIPGGFEIHLEKTDWVAPGRRSLVLRFRDSLDRSLLIDALTTCGCAVRAGASPVSQLRAVRIPPPTLDSGESLAELRERVATLAAENERLAASQEQSLAELRALRSLVASLVHSRNRDTGVHQETVSSETPPSAAAAGPLHAMTPPSDCSIGLVSGTPHTDGSAAVASETGIGSVCDGAGVQPAHAQPTVAPAELEPKPAPAMSADVAAGSVLRPPPLRLETGEQSSQQGPTGLRVHSELQPEETVETWEGQMQEEEKRADSTGAPAPASVQPPAGVQESGDGDHAGVFDGPLPLEETESEHGSRGVAAGVAAAEEEEARPATASAGRPAASVSGTGRGETAEDAILVLSPELPADPRHASAPAPALLPPSSESPEHPPSPPPPSPPAPALSVSATSPPSSARSDGAARATLPPSPPPTAHPSAAQDASPLRPARLPAHLTPLPPTPVSPRPVAQPATPVPASAMRFVPLPDTPATAPGPEVPVDSEGGAAAGLLADSTAHPPQPPLTPGPPPLPPIGANAGYERALPML